MNRSSVVLIAAMAPFAMMSACNALWGLGELEYAAGGAGTGGTRTGGAGGLGGDGGSTATGTGGLGGAPGLCGGNHAWGPFGAAAPVPNVNSVEGEIDPVVSFDDATLYFASGPPNGVDYALWAATRPSPDAAFGAPVELTALNTAGSEVAPDPSSDGQVLYFASTRDGGLGDYDLWYAVRSDAGLAFGSPSRDETLNAEGWDCDPAMSADQLSIYFSSVRPVDAGQRDLWSATRPSSTSPFAAPEPLAALNSAGDDFDPSLSADGLELFFASVRDGQRHIWVARRGLGESFVSAEPVGEINTDGTEIDGGTGAEEWAPGLSADGRTLYFVTNRAGTLGSTDIWSATRSCL